MPLAQQLSRWGHEKRILILIQLRPVHGSLLAYRAFANSAAHVTQCAKWYWLYEIALSFDLFGSPRIPSADSPCYSLT